jgi:peptidoglycan hydrolase CwlO-like protein
MDELNLKITQLEDDLKFVSKNFDEQEEELDEKVLLIEKLESKIKELESMIE